MYPNSNEFLLGVQSSKWKLEFTGLSQILEFIIYINMYIEKITDPNKVLLVLGRRTGAQRKYCVFP